MQTRLIQQLAASPAHDAETFAFRVWSGTIGGAALATENDPNTTPPSAGRILRCNPRPGTTLIHGSVFAFILCAPIAAANVSLQRWVFDDTLGLWVQLGAVAALTPTGAATNISQLNVGNLNGAQMFVQLVTNVGNVLQAFAYEYA